MSQHGAYSELKMVWWMHREGYPPSGPKQVQVILSDLCNHDCHFCAYRLSGNTSNELFVGDSEVSAYGHDNPKRWMPTDRALRLIDEIKRAGGLAIQFTGGGEPTVHPDHEDIFEKTLDVGLRAALVSNGYRWRERIFELLPRFDWVRISIDAGRAESYAKIRRVPATAWERVWANVLRLTDACAGLKDPPAVGLGFVVTPENFREIPMFAEKARHVGVDNVRFTAMFGPDEERPYRAIHQEIRTLIGRIDYLGLKVYDNFGSRLSDLVQKHPDYRECAYQHYTTYVGGDLNAYRCCILAYNRRGLMEGGDLKDRPFDEFWASQERKDDMARLDARDCPRCQFNQKNRDLLYVAGSTYSGPAVHVEWP